MVVRGGRPQSLPHPASSVQELDAWAKKHYPGAMQTNYWSAQDYSPIDELPYVGPILPGHDKIFVATGFDKWGMTNGTAAALALAGRILGGRMDWAEARDGRTRSGRAAVQRTVRSERGMRYPSVALERACPRLRWAGPGRV